MIYVVIAGILGFAVWQLVSFVQKARQGQCGGGCGSCGAVSQCSLPKNHIVDKEIPHVRL